MKLYWAGIATVLVGTQNIISTMTFAQLPENYGAIAITQNAEVWGYSYDYPTREQAEKRALEECGQADCRVQIWFKNACGAIAKDEGGNLGWAWADTREQAEAEAVSACANGSCRIETWVCTTRY